MAKVLDLGNLKHRADAAKSTTANATLAVCKWLEGFKSFDDMPVGNNCFEAVKMLLETAGVPDTDPNDIVDAVFAEDQPPPPIPPAPAFPLIPGITPKVQGALEIVITWLLEKMGARTRELEQARDEVKAERLWNRLFVQFACSDMSPDEAALKADKFVAASGGVRSCLPTHN